MTLLSSIIFQISNFYLPPILIPLYSSTAPISSSNLKARSLISLVQTLHLSDGSRALGKPSNGSSSRAKPTRPNLVKFGSSDSSQVLHKQRFYLEGEPMRANPVTSAAWGQTHRWFEGPVQASACSNKPMIVVASPCKLLWAPVKLFLIF